MPKAKSTEQKVTFNVATKVSTLATVETKWGVAFPFLGIARFTSKRKDSERTFGDVLGIRDIFGQLSRVYDVLYGNKGAERSEDWTPSDAERKKARDLSKAFDRDYRLATAKGKEGTKVVIEGRSYEVVRFGKRRVVRDRGTKELVGSRLPVVLQDEAELQEIYQDKVAAHRRTGDGIKQWAAEHGLKVK